MDKSIYDIYYHLEREHWWFQARQEIVLSLLAQHYPLLKEAHVLDIGAGTGSYIETLTKMGIQTEGHDASDKAIAYLKSKTHGKVEKKSFPEDYVANPDGQYDVILLLDVLEHLKDDSAGMRQAFRLLKTGGVLIITVPAIKSMWSPYDAISHHYRRYRAKELKALVDNTSAKIKKLSYFSTFLFFLLYTVRIIENLISKITKKNIYNPHKVGNPLNWILFSIARLEKCFLKHINFPVGSSLIMVIEKQ